MLTRRRALAGAALCLLLGGFSGCAAAQHEPDAPAPTKKARKTHAAAPDAPTEPAGPPPEIDAVLEQAFSVDPVLSGYAREAAKRRLQVLVTLPSVDKKGVRSLKRFVYRVDAEYFYPASAIKLLIATCAVEKLEELRNKPGGADLELKTPVRFIEGEGPRRRVVETTLESDLERALIVSDNEASNRLYDFVGKEELAARLERIGLTGTRLVHQLGAPRERDAPPEVELVLPKGKTFPVPQLASAAIPAPPGQILLGNTHVDESGRVVAEPMDFTSRNAVPLRELQDFLIALMRPELVPGETPKIRKDRRRLLEILGTLPSGMRANAGNKQLDELYKPLHRAILQTLPHDKVRVYGKSGRAFGFLVENFYAINDTTRRSMFVTATIYANESERLNDDRYEYSAIAAPFVARLGSVLARAFLAGD